MRSSDRRPGVLASLIFLSWAMVMVAILPGWRVAWVAVAAAAYSVWIPRRLPRVGWRAWAIVAGALFVPPLLMGGATWRLGFLSLSREGLQLGVGMATRALSLLLAFAVTIGSLTISRLADLFEQAGLKGMGFSLGVALNLLPSLRGALWTSLHSARLRGAFRRRPAHDGGLAVVASLSRAVRWADQVAIAAAARGFDPERRRNEHVRVSTGDLWVMAALAIAGATLVGL